MGDIEFISELVIGLMYGPQGGAGSIIDEYYRQFEPYEGEFPGQKEAKRLYDRAVSAVQGVLPDIKNTRWRNRTDFYTLFVGFGQLLRGNALPKYELDSLRKTLLQLGEQIDKRLANQKAQVPNAAVAYVRAVEKGSSDKARRAARHEALLTVIKKYFPTKAKQV